MTKRKTKPAEPLQPTEEQIAAALSDLMLDRPYYDARLVGSRIEFHTYGGQVLTWDIPGKPPQADAGAGEKPAEPAEKPEPRAKGAARGGKK